ncbi:MAG: MgtC/SapB family protein [Bdellovibrionales bacterium]|nr:MgtC/SapB family protein [Bdellovibrionales bacterium]
MFVIDKLAEVYTTLAIPESGLILLSATLGALIGLEREIAGKDPSLRTFSLICIGSCVFSILSREAVMDNQFADPSRIAAQIVTGIGFLGAGAIFRSRGRVSGLTTAALMWVTAAIGAAVGFNLLPVALSATVTVLFIVVALRMVHRIIQWCHKEPIPRMADGDD